MCQHASELRISDSKLIHLKLYMWFCFEKSEYCDSFNRWRFSGFRFPSLDPKHNQTWTIHRLPSRPFCHAWFASIAVPGRILPREMRSVPAHPLQQPIDFMQCGKLSDQRTRSGPFLYRLNRRKWAQQSRADNQLVLWPDSFFQLLRISENCAALDWIQNGSYLLK